MEQERIPFKRLTTSLGDCIVVEDLEVVDTYPAILDSQLPVFLDLEMEPMRQMPPEARRIAWERRAQAMQAEVAFRKLDGSRSVYGVSMDGK